MWMFWFLFYRKPLGASSITFEWKKNSPGCLGDGWIWLTEKPLKEAPIGFGVMPS